MKSIYENEIRSEEQNLILQVFSKEFTKRFRKDLNSIIHMAIPLSRDISNTENGWLTRDITMREVWQAVKQKLAP